MVKKDIRSIDIDTLVLDPEVNIRADTDETTILRYMDVFDRLPWVEVIELPNGDLVLCDGFHRVEAALRLGRRTIDAVVRPGDLPTAIEIATLMNLAHGLPLQDSEWEYAVWRLVRKIGKTPREVASEMGCSRSTVDGAVRAYEVRQRTGVNLARHTAREISRAPIEKQGEIAEWVAKKSLNWPDTRSLVDQVVTADEKMSVAQVATQAQPHLQSMADQFRYRRIVETMLANMRRLDTIGMTPARIVARLEGPETYQRWIEDADLAAEWFKELQAELAKRAKLKAVQ